MSVPKSQVESCRDGSGEIERDLSWHSDSHMGACQVQRWRRAEGFSNGEPRYIHASPATVANRPVAHKHHFAHITGDHFHLVQFRFDAENRLACQDLVLPAVRSSMRGNVNIWPVDILDDEEIIEPKALYPGAQTPRSLLLGIGNPWNEVHEILLECVVLTHARGCSLLFRPAWSMSVSRCASSTPEKLLPDLLWNWREIQSAGSG